MPVNNRELDGGATTHPNEIRHSLTNWAGYFNAPDMAKERAGKNCRVDWYGNSKSEITNSKQIQMSEIRMIAHRIGFR